MSYKDKCWRDGTPEDLDKRRHPGPVHHLQVSMETVNA